MTADEVIATVRNRGGTIGAGPGVVLIDGLALDDALRQAIRANKPELLKRLAREMPKDAGGRPKENQSQPVTGSAPTLASQGIDALLSRALASMASRYVHGALPWIDENRIDLSGEIAASEQAIGGIGKWRPFGPEQMAGLREALIRWHRAHMAGIDAFKARGGIGA